MLLQEAAKPSCCSISQSPCTRWTGTTGTAGPDGYHASKLTVCRFSLRFSYWSINYFLKNEKKKNRVK